MTCTLKRLDNNTEVKFKYANVKKRSYKVNGKDICYVTGTIKGIIDFGWQNVNDVRPTGPNIRVYINGATHNRIHEPMEYKTTNEFKCQYIICLLYTSPSPRDCS